MKFIEKFATSRFAQVPIEILLDSRLTNSDKIVLIAILSYVNAKNGMTKGLTLDTLVEMTAMARATISRSTSKLEGLGYVAKSQRGFNQPNIYVVKRPEYKEGDMRVMTDKKVSDEEYAKKVAANKRLQAESEAKKEMAEEGFIRVQDDEGNIKRMTIGELANKFSIAMVDGFEYVGITESEFESHGFS